MKARLRSVDDHGIVYDALMFACPGCVEMIGGGEGLHMLPVNSTSKSPSWKFDGNVDEPTLSPSILSHGRGSDRCHSYVERGSIRFLRDSTHSLAGKTVPLPDLPDWVADLS